MRTGMKMRKDEDDVWVEACSVRADACVRFGVKQRCTLGRMVCAESWNISESGSPIILPFAIERRITSEPPSDVRCSERAESDLSHPVRSDRKSVV